MVPAALRVFAGVAAILLALVSLSVSNFGGFLIGFLLGLIGGALAVSWAPGEAAPERRTTPTRPGRHHGRRTGGRHAPGGRQPVTGVGRCDWTTCQERARRNGANGRHSAG